MAHRDIKDDNFLIRRKPGDKKKGIKVIYEIALIDFGLAGSLSKACSLPEYALNIFRDTENINKYPGACDIFSLG